MFKLRDFFFSFLDMSSKFCLICFTFRFTNKLENTPRAINFFLATFKGLLFRNVYLEVCTNVNAMEYVWFYQCVTSIQRLSFFTSDCSSKFCCIYKSLSKLPYLKFRIQLLIKRIMQDLRL